MADELPDIARFGAVFQLFMERMSDAAEQPPSPFLGLLEEHLGTDPRQISTTTLELPLTQRANLQLALDAVLPERAEHGIGGLHAHGPVPGLDGIVDSGGYGPEVRLGPVRYVEVPVGDARSVTCIASAVLLATYRDAPLALLLVESERHGMMGNQLVLEGACAQAGVIPAFFAELRAAMLTHDVFRNRVISLSIDMEHTLEVSYLALPDVPRESVVLDPHVLERLERHTVAFSDRAEELRRRGQHLKRGILLHGPPGTGKTLTVRYLIGALGPRTTVVLTGHGLGLLDEAMAIARDLAPATVVFEDVDLVASERTRPGSHGLLFDLLNQIEGLEDDTDLIFLMTSNRPDVLEPALAARPGRVDLALEIALPDADARRRLLGLYASRITLDERLLDDVVARTDAASGAFIKELARQAELRAALAERDPTPEDLTRALDELLAERHDMTRRLLGSAPPDAEMTRAVAAAGLRDDDGGSWTDYVPGG